MPEPVLHRRYRQGERILGHLGRVLCAVATALPGLGDAGQDGEAAGPNAPYRVIEGAVDAGTYNGYRRYHASCSHCHGPDGVGSSFGPSLIEPAMAFDAFAASVRDGSQSGTSVMRGFADDPNVEPYIEDIYAYLHARADGALGRGRPRRPD